MNLRMSSKNQQTLGEIVDGFYRQVLDPVGIGDRFEKLVTEVLPRLQEYEIKKVYRFGDWPDRERLTGLKANDKGIDLIGIRNDNRIIAIQCKCFKDKHVSKEDVDSFLALSEQGSVFAQRWVITTSEWTHNLVDQIQSLAKNSSSPPVRIDFLKHADVVLPESPKQPTRDLLPQQQKAFADVIDGFKKHDRGRLIMACGTGKTFTSLRISEEIVKDGGRIIFVAPSIALVSQSRREWLTHKSRGLQSLVICSDKSAGGKKEVTIKTYELACNVTTDSQKIAQFLKEDNGLTKVLFCTYQSLWSVINAQLEFGAPEFDLVLCDEAHRTTGVDKSTVKGKSSGFQAVHNDLLTTKRLYMTATEKIYNKASMQALKAKGIEVIDMSDGKIYGPLFHKLKFKDAIEADMLCDYRVIAMGIGQDHLREGLRNQLIKLADEEIRSSVSKPLIVTDEDLLRILGTSLAINGLIEGSNIEVPKQLYRNIVFANSIARSKFYAKGLDHPQLKRLVTGRKKSGRALKTEIQHLDASDSSHGRLTALHKLNKARSENTARVLCNVGLFSEGVDVPALDAITFIEPRKSQIEIVQAVGRVMRRPLDGSKRFGYIIIPIPITANQTFQGALEEHGYEAIGQVLRALQSNDERLAESIARFVTVVETPTPNPTATSDVVQDPERVMFDWHNAEASIYSQLVTASGLGKAGKLITDEIARETAWAAKVLEAGRKEAAVDEDFIDGLAEAMGIKVDNNEPDICKIAALLLSNACLLQKRLCSLEKWQIQLTSMGKIARANLDAIDMLSKSWQVILDQDYKPVFMPALAVLKVLPRRPFVAVVLRRLAECAENVADQLASLGYDHAGPLYHKIMPKAEAKGAFYTNNLSALILAKLTIDKNWIDWSDDQAIKNLKIMDPACGTGTLLMASLKVIKERFIQARRLDLTNLSHQRQLINLHKTLVENVIYGLDINQCGIQLAASSLTLGAPSVDYRKMNLHTLKHGVQPDGGIRAGSLEILNHNPDDRQASFMNLILSSDMDKTQVNNEDKTFPTSDIDLVIMNPPFTNNAARSSQYSPRDRKNMQKYEKSIQKNTAKRNLSAGNVINSNALQTFFIPIADQVLNPRKGTISKVMPVTVCTASSSLAQRQFLASKFHIERVITSHDPKNIAFSENTDIHESILIGHRRNDNSVNQPTEFISLKRMPQNENEVNDLIRTIENDVTESPWFIRSLWSANLVKQGNWTPTQWLNGNLAEIAREIRESSNLEPIGNRYKIDPVGQSVRGAFEECAPGDPDARLLFWSISSKIHNRLSSKPESSRRPKSSKQHIADSLCQKSNNVLVAQRYRTTTNGLTAVYSKIASVGSGFMPINIPSEIAKGFVAYWNSTVALLMLLNLRSKTLDYPSWSQDQLHSIGIPGPENPAWNDLNEAFELVKNQTILPLKDAENCRVRLAIDEAAAKALGISNEKIAHWRSMLAKEPTISNNYAT